MADTAFSKMGTRKPSNRMALKDKNPSGNEANIEAGKVPESNPTLVQAVSVSDPAKENREILSRPRKSSKNPKATAASKKESKQTTEEVTKEMEEKLQELKLEKEKEEKLKLKDEELQKLEFKPTTMNAKEEEKNDADDSNKPKDAGESQSTPSTPSIDECDPKKSTTDDAKLGKPKRTIKRPNYLKDYHMY